MAYTECIKCRFCKKEIDLFKCQIDGMTIYNIELYRKTFCEFIEADLNTLTHEGRKALLENNL